MLQLWYRNNHDGKVKLQGSFWSCCKEWMRIIWWQLKSGRSSLGSRYNFRQWDWRSVTDDWTYHKDSGLLTWNSQDQIGSFRILWFIHCGNGETSHDVWLALVLSGNRFYGLESVSFSFSSWAISSRGLFILLVCTRKTHSDGECIRIHALYRHL